MALAEQPAFSCGAQRFELRLPFLPDDVDLGVVGDRFQRDVRRALVDEALADVVVRRRVGLDFARDLLLLARGPPAVGEQIIGIARAHQPRAGERQRDARGVDGDPAPAPLLGDDRRSCPSRRSDRARGRRDRWPSGCSVRRSLGWFGRHRPFVGREARYIVSRPNVAQRVYRKVVQDTGHTECVFPASSESIRLVEPFRPSGRMRLPVAPVAGVKLAARRSETGNVARRLLTCEISRVYRAKNSIRAGSAKSLFCSARA